MADETLNLDHLLGKVRYRIDQGRPHLQVEESVCQSCQMRVCLEVCPVEVYKWRQDKLEVHWQRCLECGACRRLCSQQALRWEFPRGGHGVCFRLG